MNKQYKWRPFPREFLMDRLIDASNKASSLLSEHDRTSALNHDTIWDTRSPSFKHVGAAWVRTGIPIKYRPDNNIWVPVVLLEEIKTTTPDYSTDNFPDDF